jgi:MvaI/BcnI restriction endonuclease family protein
LKKRINIFDSEESKERSLDSLISNYKSLGVTRIIFKQLSPNDNSKNQPYVGGHLTDLGFLPTREIIESLSSSNKTKDPKRQIRYTAELNYSWLSAEGQLYPAPQAKLIYYPQYPEVRLSGFLQGCLFDSGGWMDPNKKGRSEGRVLIFGIKTTGEIIAWLATPESRIAIEIIDFPSVQLSGVFNEIELDGSKREGSAKDILIAELRRIHDQQWIEGKKLNTDGVAKPYTARNGGGYTLEAELGVLPNGIAEPDFMGWEIKQFGVKKCHLTNSKLLTLMTPEPDGGFYVEQGAEAFIRKYGYPSERIADRLDFTGRHLAGEVCKKSNLKLVTEGYDPSISTITDAAGCIAILDSNGNAASSWSFSKIMEHWKRKHARSSYIPSLSMNRSEKVRCYSYCSNIRLFEGTSFIKLLQAINNQDVYYDPGIKLENASTNPSVKRRSQFRIKSVLLDNLYDSREDVDLTGQN